jgi:glycosyltransferase involved in cell wall biosynthesis
MSFLPLVSCITPTYNRREFWPRCVRCFLNQDYPNLEWVILDNGTDTIDDLLPDDLRIKYHRLEGPKLSHGMLMNVGFERSEGEFGIVVDDDDWYAGDRVTRQILPMVERSDFQVSGTSQIYYYVHGKEEAYRYVNLTDRSWMAAIAIRRTAWETYRFNDKSHGADFDLLHNIPRSQWCDVNDPHLMVSAIHVANASPKRLPNPSFIEIPWTAIHEITKGAL